jgi:hypothetical protein
MAQFGVGPVTFYPGVLEYELNDPNGMVGRYLKRRGEIVLLAARAQVGVDTGDLKASLKIIHRRGGPGQYLWIGSELDHALVHHEGSRPHVIAARNQPFLRFSTGGRIIYTHAVQHPGTRPNRYLSDNLNLVYVS